MGIDLTNGCRNMTFAQNVTFGYQGLPSLLESAAWIEISAPPLVLLAVGTLGAALAALA